MGEDRKKKKKKKKSKEKTEEREIAVLVIMILFYYRQKFNRDSFQTNPVQPKVRCCSMEYGVQSIQHLRRSSTTTTTTLQSRGLLR